MARPRTFDIDDALACIRNAFWAHGVRATSIGDLGRATGLSAGSLYKAFDSKAALLERVLDDYLAQAIVRFEALLDREDPLDGLDAWLRVVADAASDGSPTRGCFAVQCAAELAGDDARVRERLRHHDARLRALIESSLSAAVERHAIAIDPAVHAGLLLTVVNGLQLEARKGIERDAAHAIVDAAMAGLRPPSRRRR